MSDVLIIGIGNEYRGDDGAGLVVVRSIQSKQLPGIQVIEQTGEGAALMEAFKDAGCVVLIDAVSSGAAPGTVYRLDAHDGPIPARFFSYSTHAFSVAEAVELARALGELPPCLVIYGIEGADFAAGIGLSADVKHAAETVIEQVIQQVHE